MTLAEDIQQFLDTVAGVPAETFRDMLDLRVLADQRLYALLARLEADAVDAGEAP